MPVISRLKIALFLTTLSFIQLTQAQLANSNPVVSPQINADHSVTFRINAPNANSVGLGSSDMTEIPFGQNLALTPNDSGVWEATIGPIAPGSYRYNFVVDGIKVLDANSPMVSEANDNPWSYVHVPGNLFMDTLDVPHGLVSEQTYNSTVVGRARRMHVYTPPGFGKEPRSYPVFYLLHGAMDSDDSWSTVGRAGFILDNLIAQNKAEPMIVVMPAGHTGPFNMNRDGMQLADFVNEFKTDIKPFVEKNYPVLTDRAHTAIAGLSMGGAQTMDIAFSDLSEFGYISVFSSGVFSIMEDNSWETAHAKTLNDPALKAGLEHLWYAIGSDDFLLATSKKTVEMLQAHQFDVEYMESTGGHTWINWRQYLNAFAQKLFK